MLSTRKYVRRPVPRAARKALTDLLYKMHDSACAPSLKGRVEIEITMRNRTNPNGFTARADANGTVTVERFLNLGWARRRGYDV